MRVSDILLEKNRKLVSVTPETKVARAVALMAVEQVGALVVRDLGGQLLGILSEHAIIGALVQAGGNLLERSVSEILIADGPTVSPADSVISAMRTMTERRARHLPVISDMQVIGLISVGDVLKSRLAEKAEEITVLQDIARVRLANAGQVE